MKTKKITGKVDRGASVKAPISIRITGRTEERMWRLAKALHLKIRSHKSALITALVDDACARMGLTDADE